jgi:signal transduction histidine kinase
MSSGGRRELLEVPGLAVAWAMLSTPGLETVRTDAGEARVLVMPLLYEDASHGVFAVAIFPDDAVADVSQAVRTIALVGAAVLLLTSVLAWSIAGRVIRPVKELTTTARSIGERDLSARIPVQGDDELAELGRTFNEMLDRLESAFGTQRRVLDDVAHELRTPITIVQGHLEMMSMEPDSAQETRTLVLDELDRMARYVGDLLLVAKAEQPDFLHPTVVDLRELTDQLIPRLNAFADRQWEVEQRPDRPVATVIADPHRLTQAVLALAANAAQHTSPGDRIGIGVDAGRDTVAMWVRDTGPGIDPFEQAHLFDRFARSADSRAHRPDGTGLGLAIVAAIARAHGGTVEVDSEPGQGACFTIRIPRRVPSRHRSAHALANLAGGPA